ncbi:MAG: helix-turn-helix domain-containing protein [Terrimicrobiaceae bacterium]|nr:helix-turn-helix domain-containing protein [Terrimicrobiaceae bacterium]
MNSQLVDALVESRIFREYANAWQATTGMPLQFLRADAWNHPVHSSQKRAPLCALLAGCSGTCSVCLQSRARLLRNAAESPCIRTCGFGLCETAVPVRLGRETIGFLLTGQVLREAPTVRDFEELRAVVDRTGTLIDAGSLRAAYFRTPVVGPNVQRAALRMLAIFAQHLASLANQIAIGLTHTEPRVLQRTKAYINEHLDEEVSLAELARRVGTSRFYICKLFKRSMGITFTEYRARCRIERAKSLLLEPNRRVSEVAYDAGFQSLTHFNRIFRRFVGTSPTDFRMHLAHA